MTTRTRTLSPELIRPLALLAMTVVIVATFAFIQPRYLSYANLTAISRHMASNGLAALGLTFVVVVRRFDLSFAGIASFAAVTVGFMIASGYDLAPAIGVGIVAAVLFGLVNGAAISYFGLPDIITTIATGSIAGGLAYIYTGGQTIFENFMTSGLLDINDSRLFRINLSVYFFLGIYFFAWLVLQRSRLGVGFYATGDNPVSAFFSGISTRAYTMAAFAICGGTAALAVLLLIAESGTANTNHGATLLMPAYASVFLGAALLGGASVLATLAGTMLITILLDGFSLVGVPYYYSDGVVSLILLFGVILFDERLRRSVAMLRLLLSARPGKLEVSR